MPARKPRILVVDDDHECRLLLSSLVSRTGFIAEAVADGNMALTMVRTRPPDLVLLDATIPGLDGWEVCRAIKRTDSTKHTPVIMLTAAVTDDARAKSLEAGADEFVPKPFDTQTLLELIRRLLQISEAARHLDIGADAVSAALGEPRR